MLVVYSQYEEERYILDAVGSGAGTFLDIGAYHPTVFSNTRALYERGWSGVLVEPSPEPFLNLLKEYGSSDRITLVHAAIGAKRDIVEFHATANAVSTSDDGVFAKWKAHAKYDGSFLAPQISMVDLLYAIGHRQFEFVNFDAEGQSVDLFREFLSTESPQCVCVEHDDRIDECLAISAGRGYREVYRNGTNLVFAR